MSDSCFSIVRETVVIYVYLETKVIFDQCDPVTQHVNIIIVKIAPVK